MQSETFTSRIRAVWLYLQRVVWAACTGFFEDDCYSKASALAYYSLLSLVPILAIALGIAKGFGIEAYLENEVQRGILEQREVAQQLIGFAYLMLENTRGGVIAGVGVIVLLWTALQLLGSIESYFNDIWEVSHARPVLRRFTDYLAILILCPICLVASSSLSVYLIAALSNLPKNALTDHFGSYVFLLYHALPFVLSWILFSFMYIFIPNVYVRWRNALVAALIAGIAYQIVQRIYIYFQIGVASYGAIYGSLAALPLFLVWIHLSCSLFC
jgi:membrane protein